MMTKEVLECWNLVLAELDVYSGSPSFSGTLYCGEVLTITWAGSCVETAIVGFPITAEGLCKALDWMEIKRAEHKLLQTETEGKVHE